MFQNECLFYHFKIILFLSLVHKQKNAICNLTLFYFNFIVTPSFVPLPAHPITTSDNSEESDSLITKSNADNNNIRKEDDHEEVEAEEEEEEEEEEEGKGHTQKKQWLAPAMMAPQYMPMNNPMLVPQSTYHNIYQSHLDLSSCS